ncbi:MAG: ABC transporter substrate-binding protein [Chloroflexota bacterium]|nr:ABC transporter substrate-binding protein [Chloroflexota bacterium]
MLTARTTIYRWSASLALLALLAGCAQPQAAAPTAAPTAPTKPTAAAATAPSPAAQAAPSAAPSAAASKPAQAPAAAGAVKLTNGGKVVIGVINDQSGVYLDLGGVNGVKAVQMAIDDFKAKYGENALGGPIEVVSADHQNKPDLASAKAAEFYDRLGVDMIVDVPTSSAGLAVAEVAKAKKKLYINVGAATTELTGPACNKYTFAWIYDTWMLANGTGTQVTNNGAKKWYILYPDYAFGQDMDRSFRKAIEGAGGQILASDPTPFPSDDFSTFLLKAPTLQPEVLGAMQAGQDLRNVVKQYNEFKLKDQHISLAIGLLFDPDIAALGPEAFAGTIFTTGWLWTLDDQARGWADKFKQIAGVRPSYVQAGNYSAAFQYLEAIRRAGTDDPDAVVGQLEGFTFEDAIMRHASIRKEDHRVLHDAYLAQVKAPNDVSEPGDYSTLLNTIPAEKAFRPVSESLAAGCKMS